MGLGGYSNKTGVTFVTCVTNHYKSMIIIDLLCVTQLRFFSR